MSEVKKEKPTALPGNVDIKTQTAQLDSFYLAHISDLHLTSLLHAKGNQLCNKRLLGYLSWRRKRRWVHRPDIVEALVKDLQAIRPQHIAVTGDLTHIGLPGEFSEAAQWLPCLGSPERVTVIPGNHEAYAGRNWMKYLTAWTPYLLSDNSQQSSGPEDFFPSLRVRGQLALIGLCSAHPSLPFLAVGSLGKNQLLKLTDLLKETGESGLMRVVLVHHPPVHGTTNWRKRLVDSEAFADVIRQHGAELVLHGHTHGPTYRQMQGPSGTIPVVGAASSSELNPNAGRCAEYNLYHLKRDGSNWKLTMHVRRYSEQSADFSEAQRISLEIPPLREETVVEASYTLQQGNLKAP